jgi:hypothetical protein
MRSAPSWIRRGLVLVLMATVVAVVTRAFGSGGSGTGTVPTIGGDTWPPVPVKDPGRP